MIARPPWLRSIAVAQLALAAAAIVDVVWAAVATGLGVLPTARAVLAAAGLALPAGALAGALAAIARWGWNERRAPDLAEVIAAPIAVGAWALGWLGFARLAVTIFHDATLTALAIALAGFAVAPIALVVFAGARRAAGPLARRFPRAAPYAAAAWLVVGVAAAPWQRGVGIACAAGLVALALVAFAPRWLARASWRVVAIATVAAAALALSPVGDDRAAHAALAGRAAFLPSIERAIAPLVDFDGDGYLSVLGGGDCAGFDAARSPDGVEVEGNGVDEDCRFGDLAPGLAAAPPAPSGSPAGVVGLLTIGGLCSAADGAWAPALPELAKRAAAGVRFTHPVGVEGRFRDVAGLLIAGDLPTDFTGEHGGFPPGGATIPGLVERAGRTATIALPKTISLDSLATQFAKGSSSNKHGDAAKLVADAHKLSALRGFVWAHLDLGDPEGKKAAKQAKAIDAAAVDLVDALLAAPGVARVVIVGLSRNAAARPDGGAPCGGPLAVLGGGKGDAAAAIAPATVDAPVGLFDVYPTLLDALGLASDTPILGASLLRPLPARAGALGGWIDGEARLAVAGDAGLLVHDPDTRRFRAGGEGLDEDDDAPAAYAPLLALARDGWLAPRLQARNQALAAARVDGLPDDLDGAPAVIGGALRVLGCTSHITPDRQANVSIYMQGGDLLLPGDLLSFKLSSAHSGSMRSRVAPVGGAHRFGDWTPGELIAHTMRVDLRPVNPGTAILWVGVLRGGKLLRVTGPGATPDFGRICNVEVPQR